MINLAMKNGVVLSVAIVIVCLFGLLAIFRVPVQMIPDLDPRTITVRTSWPGASPQDVEKEIVVEQEEYLRSIPNLERIVSTVTTGSARIELEFPHGVDINEVLIRVNNALAQVSSYPENVDQPRIITSSFSNNPFMFFRITPLPGNPRGVDLESMHDFVDDHIRTRIERVPGVSEVELWGGAKRQIRVYVDPLKLVERGISITQLRDVIRARNIDISGGDVDSGKRRYLLRTIGRFQSVEEIENMVIAQRGGVLVRLREVGYAEMDRFELRVKSFANGQANMTLGIRRQVGANVIEVMDGVMDKVEELREGLLKQQGLNIELTSEDVQYIKDAVAVVRQNLLIGAALATLVLYLFLRSVSATVIGAVGIPVCTIAAFLGLLVMGRTINVISLAGIAFAIGMTLDNNIVVLENIYRHWARGKSRWQAAQIGVKEVWPAVLASTLTTVFVFLPIIFVQQEAGQLYSDIAIAISASIVMSMLVAITVVPTACSRLLQTLAPSPPAAEQGPGLAESGNHSKNKIMDFVEWLMGGVFRRLTLILVVVAVTGLIIIYLTPKAEYLPEGEESKTFSFMFAPPGYNLGEMEGILHRVHQYFLPFVNDHPSRFDNGEAEVPALNFVVSYARSQSLLMIAETREPSHIDELISAISKKFSEVPGMISFSSRGSIFASNLGGSRSINLDISGPDLPVLFENGLKVFRKTKEIFDQPQVRPQPSNLVLSQPLLEIHPDWDRVAEMGLNTRELGYSIWALTDGAFVDEFFLADEKIDMYLYSTTGTIQQPQDLQHLLLYTQEGGVVPLNAVAKIKETVYTETIRRVDSERTVTLSIIPPRQIPLETAVARVKREIIAGMNENGEISAGVKINISGASDRLQATRDALRENFLVAVVIAYLLMVAIFSHWGYPLIIMTTVPLGISGGIIGLWLLNTVGAHLDWIGMEIIHQPFDVITMLGFLVLIGTVVNNPILLVERTLKNIRDHNMRSIEAVVESTRVRLRPIIMSSVTTVLGLSPLVFLPGAGSELYRGLGTIVMFGILFSTIITLFFMPAVLALILQSRDWVRKKYSLQ